MNRKEKIKKYPIYSSDISRLSSECDYLILYSNRNTGKSYSSKEYVLKKAYEESKEFVYLRRNRISTKDIDVNDYFPDMNISKITKGEYDYINVFRKRIYFAKEEDGKLVNKKRIGYVFNLQEMEDKKSLMYPNVDTIIYEEFVTDRYYLNNEPDTLMNFVSSIFRDRKGLVILIGNKISKFNPYYKEWELTNLPTQKTNTIDTYTKKDIKENKDIIIKVWNIKPLDENSGMFFGNSAKNIDGDSYLVKSQPKLEDDISNYDCIYKIVLSVQNIKFLMKLLSHKKDLNNLVWYVEPKTTQIRSNTRVVSDIFDTDILHTIGFIPLNDSERNIFQLINNKRICFVDNLTGTEFYQALDSLKKL